MKEDTNENIEMMECDCCGYKSEDESCFVDGENDTLCCDCDEEYQQLGEDPMNLYMCSW